MNKVQHMIHHFKDELYKNLPPKTDEGLPYKCPEESCKFETKHKPDWARHYGSVHKVMERLLKQYMEEHPEAWANQPENRDRLKESTPTTPLIIQSGSSTSAVAARPQSVPSASGSDHLDASEGLLCKLTDLQQIQSTSTPMSIRVSGAVTSQPIISQSGSGRLSVELPKSDLTKFITSALTEKNVPHASELDPAPSPSSSSSMTQQQILEQKVQNVINEQQQILNSQKAQIDKPEATATTSVSQPLMSNTIKTSGFQLPQQPVPQSSMISHQSPAASPVKLVPSESSSLQQLLQNSGGKNIVITDPKTGHKHLVVQKSQAGQQQHIILQKTQQQQQQQQYVVQTKDGQIIQVQGQPKPGGEAVVHPGQQQQLVVQTSNGQQMVVNQSQVRLQQQQQQQSVQQQQPQQPQQGPSGQGQQIIQSKIVQHNGRTYLVQVRAQKPIEPGKQIVIKTNQPGLGGSGLVQEVMDEVIRQQYQKQSEQQKISSLAAQLEQQTQQHLSQQAGASPLKTSTPSVSPGVKLTQQQQQLLLPTEPHPQITAQHQMKQQQQPVVKPTSILQQQLELPMTQSPSAQSKGIVK